MASWGAVATSGSPVLSLRGTPGGPGRPPSVTSETAQTPDSCPTSVRLRTPVFALNMWMRLFARPTTTQDESIAIDVGIAGFATGP